MLFIHARASLAIIKISDTQIFIQIKEKPRNQAVISYLTSLARVLTGEVTNILLKVFKRRMDSCHSNARLGKTFKQETAKEIQFQWEKLHQKVQMELSSWKLQEGHDSRDF